MTILSVAQGISPAVGQTIERAAARKTAPVATDADAAFGKSLAAAGTSAKSEAERVAAVAGTSISAVYRGSKSGELSTGQQFESFVLRSFVETMLPKDNTSFFGTGTAGEIWKSMLAERIGDEMARDGGIGIAEMIAKRGTAAGATKDAEKALAPSDAISLGAGALKPTL